jgi:hypothetical protein
MARSQVWTVSSPLLQRRAATSRKALESISRPPVPSHSTLLMALSEIEGPVAGLTAFARDTELREFSHRRTPTKADGFAQGAPQHGASQCSKHWERWGQEAKKQACLFHSRSGPPAHLERTYPCSSVLIRVPYLSAFSAPLREIILCVRWSALCSHPLFVLHDDFWTFHPRRHG